MHVTGLLIVASLAAGRGPTLILEKVRSVENPAKFDLLDNDHGDRGVASSCSLGEATKVSLSRANDATIEVDRNGEKRSVQVRDIRGVGRSTLACGPGGTFYYVNPRHGQVLAYAADRLFHGQDPILWTRQLAPFTSIDDAGGVMTDASVATVVQVRQNFLLVEWFYRKNGETEFFHAVFDGTTGAELGKLGPSDLLMKTNENDRWWILFHGGGHDIVNYVPRSIYRLKFAPLDEGGKTAAETLSALRTQRPLRSTAVAKLSPNPVINHMIALLTPTRTAPNSTLEFCPQVPAQRARYWLGSDYHEGLGEVARNILVAFWAERQSAPVLGSPIDAWFKAEIATRDPMKAVLARFNPQDDRWIADYQHAMLDLGGPTFERLFEKYGTGSGAVVRVPGGGNAP